MENGEWGVKNESFRKKINFIFSSTKTYYLLLITYYLQLITYNLISLQKPDKISSQYLLHIFMGITPLQ